MIDIGEEGKTGEGREDKGRIEQKTSCCLEKKQRKGIQEVQVWALDN